MLRLVFIVLLAIGYVEAISDAQIKTVQGAVEKLEQMAQQVEQQSLEIKKEVEETKKSLEDMLKETQWIGVNVISSKQSRPYSNWQDPKYATDGDLSTCNFLNQHKPWYSAEVGTSFTAIKLNFTLKPHWLTDSYTLYTVDDGVETKCAEHDVEKLSEEEKKSWAVECRNSGTGFKISSSTSSSTSFSTVLSIFEVTAVIQTKA